MEREEGREVPRTKSEIKNAEIKTLPIGEVSNVVVAEEFPPNLKTQVASLFLVWSVR